MGDTDISSNYHQTQLDRVDSDIRSCDDTISEAQERRRVAVEFREMLISQFGLDAVNPVTAFCDLSVRKAVYQSIMDSVVGLKPNAIVQYMLSRGYVFPGETNRNTRVSNEILNLIKSGLVVKEDGLYYELEGGAM